MLINLCYTHQENTTYTKLDVQSDYDDYEPLLEEIYSKIPQGARIVGFCISDEQERQKYVQGKLSN